MLHAWEECTLWRPRRLTLRSMCRASVRQTNADQNWAKRPKRNALLFRATGLRKLAPLWALNASTFRAYLGQRRATREHRAPYQYDILPPSSLFLLSKDNRKRQYISSALSTLTPIKIQITSQNLAHSHVPRRSGHRTTRTDPVTGASPQKATPIVHSRNRGSV